MAESLGLLLFNNILNAISLLYSKFWHSGGFYIRRIDRVGYLMARIDSRFS